MMATLVSLAGYLLYFVCMVAPSSLVFNALSDAPSFCDLPQFVRFCIACILPFVLKNFQWVVLISESHYTFPSGVYQVIAILLCLACYHLIVYIIIGLVLRALVWCATLGQHHEIFYINLLPDWIFVIIFSVTFVVTDGVTSYLDLPLISEFLSSSLRSLTHIVMTTPTLLPLAGYLVYVACMLALSYVVLIIAHCTIENPQIWCPELIHTSIVGLTLLLLNMMWGSPFQKPSIDSDMKSALVGIAGYLIFVVCSMALSYHFFGARLLLKTYVISLTFVLFDMFVKPSSVPDMIATLIGLAGTIATALLALFFLVALSFLVFIFLHTWAEIVLPSGTRRHYPGWMFVIIVSLTFMVMKTMLGAIPPVGKPSIFSNMRAGLVSINNMISAYHGAYVVIRNLSVLVIPLLSMKSRHILSMYHWYTMAAFIVALGLVLTMPLRPDTPTENPAASTLVAEITSFMNSQIERMDGETKQLTDS